MKTRKFFTLTRLVSVAVMTAFATFGRIAFAAIPNFKPTLAIVILSGMALGPLSGGLVGALSALISNFYFGQGLWTPVQMLAMGLCGALAGLLTKCKFLTKLYQIVAFGLFSAFLYGMILDTWHILCFVRPLTKAAVFASLIGSLFFNLSHAAATALFLWLLAMPFLRRLRRILQKYGELETPSSI